jgi:type II secretory pathway pseudopilin PulG
MKFRGFSLLEFILYIAILSLMSVVLAGTFLSLVRGRSQADARSEVNSNARFAMDRMIGDVASASAVAIPATASPTNQLQLSVGGQTISYSLSSGHLLRTVDANPADQITGNAVAISSLTFTRSENFNTVLSATTTSVQVQLTIGYAGTSPDQAYSTTLQGGANLR